MSGIRGGQFDVFDFRYEFQWVIVFLPQSSAQYAFFFLFLQIGSGPSSS